MAALVSPGQLSGHPKLLVGVCVIPRAKPKLELGLVHAQVIHREP